MKQLRAESIVVRSGNHLSATVDGDTVLLDSDTSVYYGMNEVGTEVWEHLQSPASVAEVQSRIADEYDVKEAVVAADVTEFLTDLIEVDLVEVRSMADES